MCGIIIRIVTFPVRSCFETAVCLTHSAADVIHGGMQRNAMRDKTSHGAIHAGVRSEPRRPKIVQARLMLAAAPGLDAKKNNTRSK